jgi:hypothetical protein
MIHTHKCIECQVPMTCCCEDRRDVNRLTGKRRPLRCATCEPSSVDVHYPNPFDEIKTVSREPVAPVPAENAAETGAGSTKETKQTPAPAAPTNTNFARLLLLANLLERGVTLVESAVTHVSHGGPTRADAENWLLQAKAVLEQ